MLVRLVEEWRSKDLPQGVYVTGKEPYLERNYCHHCLRCGLLPTTQANLVVHLFPCVVATVAI